MRIGPCTQTPLASALCAVACALMAGSSVAADSDATFSQKVKPLLQRKCFECHSSKSDELKGNLKLESVDDILKGGDSGPAVKAGDDDSLLLKVIRYQVEDKQMPPSGKLDDEDIRVIAEWVKGLKK